ncbi:unnamed protein product [Alternaria alternata]
MDVPVAANVLGTLGARVFTAPSILMAVASATLLAAGVYETLLGHLRPPYCQRYLLHIVGIDARGDLFSLVSVVFQPRLDILGLVIYGTELVLWIGIFVCGAYYNLPTWYAAKKKRKEATRA